MEWMQLINEAVMYIEDHLLTMRSSSEAAKHVGISEMYLQQGFRFLTGYSAGEYIRNRRLSEAAQDLAYRKMKVVDAALKYGYETPESFTKAFVRFHGVTPRKAGKDIRLAKVFLPVKVRVEIIGGNDPEYRIEKEKAFTVIGFMKTFDSENSYQTIPVFWDETVMNHAYGSSETADTVKRCRVGEFGVCIDDPGEQGRFRYMIAGRYDGGMIPEGMSVYDIPERTWVKFTCEGALPQAMQSVNTQIFRQWLPSNREYHLCGPCTLEWYSSEGNTEDEDYRSEIWIPAEKREYTSS